MVVTALILAGYGINCEAETAAAYRLAGASADIVHIGDILRGARVLDDYNIVTLPGGFSFGDDLGSGKVLANRLLFRKIGGRASFKDSLDRFLANGGYVLGICNGFQALTRMGLLPAASLMHNDSGKFEDRWIRLSVGGAQISPFLKGIQRIELPVRHGEGKLVFQDSATKEYVRKRALDCMYYCDENWEATDEYPHNPNGSELACAALSDESGHILGMMPHPEGYLSFYNHPAWAEKKRNCDTKIDEEGEGLKIFRNIVEHITHNKLETRRKLKFQILKCSNLKVF